MTEGLVDHASPEHLAGFASGRLPEAEIALVASHLDRCATCLAALETLPEDPLILRLRTPATPAPAPAEVAPPEELLGHPRYRVLRFLGRGGMGTVYEAQQVHLHRRVALKVIRGNLLDRPEVVERFHREVKAAGRLSHPNIVAAFDADQVGGVHFLVTEFIEGATLDEVLQREGPLPIAVACDYARQAALGLQHAFERGMVHRDITPRNLMLSTDGVVKILDFGLARLAAESDAEGSLTGANAVLGTPDYLAPEQIRDARQADIRADIYSLGCTLYFLLAGHSPFPKGPLIEKIVRHVALPPSPLRQARADVHAGLEQIVGRMMAKDPGDRFATPAEAAEALWPFVDSDDAPGISARRLPMSSRLRKSLVAAWRRYGAAALGLLAVVALLYAVAQWGTPRGRVETAPEPVAPLPGSGETERTASDSQIACLTGHTDRLSSVDISPDGRLVASAGFDKTVRVWDIGAGEQRHWFLHTFAVIAVAFSPDGRHVAFGGGDGVAVAELDAASTVRRTHCPGHRVTAIAFAQDHGMHLLSAGEDNTVRGWDIADLSPLGSVEVDHPIFVRFSCDGGRVLYSTGGKKSA